MIWTASLWPWSFWFTTFLALVRLQFALTKLDQEWESLRQEDHMLHLYCLKFQQTFKNKYFSIHHLSLIALQSPERLNSFCPILHLFLRTVFFIKMSSSYLLWYTKVLIFDIDRFITLLCCCDLDACIPSRFMLRYSGAILMWGISLGG